MLSNGFSSNECDKCVYVKDSDRGYVILFLYIDDILIVGNNDEMIRTTKRLLNQNKNPMLWYQLLPKRQPKRGWIRFLQLKINNTLIKIMTSTIDKYS
mgnify:CR=1 FL=1